jgi:hypothetical protein
MKTTLTLLFLAASVMNANAQERPGKPLPEITVHPRNPYVVAVRPREFNEAFVREWIAYCQPVVSVAALSSGIRHYVYNGNAGCEYGLSAP